MSRKRQNRNQLDARIAKLEVLPQAVVAYGRDLVRGERLDFHAHRRAQLVYASNGVMAVTTRSATYLVPPQRAVWMPGGVEHRIDARSALEMRTLYIEAAAGLATAASAAAATGENRTANSAARSGASLRHRRVSTQPIIRTPPTHTPAAVTWTRSTARTSHPGVAVTVCPSKR